MKCPFVIKVCKKCKRILVANEMNFHKAKTGKYDLRADCKICVKKRYKEKNFGDNPFNNIDSNKVWNYCPFCIKVCTKCGKILVANEINFNKNKNGKWGLDSKCNECRKKYRDVHKEYHNEYNKQWYQSHKEDVLEKNKQYREENKEKESERHKKWHKNNPEKVFNRDARRRLKEESQGRGITKEQWLEMMKFFDWRCAYSGEILSNNRTIDHIIPLSKGGEHEIWNCVPMIRKYNSSKHTRNWINWYNQQNFYSEERLLKIIDWITYSAIKWKYNRINKGE